MPVHENSTESLVADATSQTDRPTNERSDGRGPYIRCSILLLRKEFPQI